MKRMLLLLLVVPLALAAQKPKSDEVADLYKQFGMRPPPKVCRSYIDAAYDYGDQRETNLSAENRKLWSVVESSARDYAALRDKYDRLTADYNRVLSSYVPPQRQVSAPDPMLTPRQPLNCTAMRIGDNITTLNCY